MCNLDDRKYIKIMVSYLVENKTITMPVSVKFRQKTLKTICGDHGLKRINLRMSLSCSSLTLNWIVFCHNEKWTQLISRILSNFKMKWKNFQIWGTKIHQLNVLKALATKGKYCLDNVRQVLIQLLFM